MTRPGQHDEGGEQVVRPLASTSGEGSDDVVDQRPAGEREAKDTLQDLGPDAMGFDVVFGSAR